MRKCLVGFVLVIVFCLMAACGNITDTSNSSSASLQHSSSTSSLQSSDKGDVLPYNNDFHIPTAVDYYKQQCDQAENSDDSMDDIIKRLWYLANAIYNCDDFTFSVDAEIPDESLNWASASRYLNFDEMCNNVFTDKARDQLLSAIVGLGTPFIYPANGEYYHLGSWKTGYRFEESLSSYRILNQTESKIDLEMSFDWLNLDGQVLQSGTTPMTLIQQNGKWLVDSYHFPEAQYSK